MEPYEVFYRVLPIALAGALSPFNVSVVILMLLSKDHPVARPLAFIGGFTLSLILIGTIAVGFVNTLYAPPLRPGAYLLLVMLGVLTLVLGTRQIIAKVDPDEPPHAWMEQVSKFRAFTAFWVGFFLSMLGVKTLAVYIACLGIITTSGLAPNEVVIETLIVVIVIILPMLVPVLIYVFQPERGAELLGEFRNWMMNRQHVVAGAVLVLVGLLLVYFGVTGLI